MAPRRRAPFLVAFVAATTLLALNSAFVQSPHGQQQARDCVARAGPRRQTRCPRTVAWQKESPPTIPYTGKRSKTARDSDGSWLSWLQQKFLARDETTTLLRIIIPTILAFVGGFFVFEPISLATVDLLQVAKTGNGPILKALGNDQAQFQQNFINVNGLLFTILCGNTYKGLYEQQEQLYHALFIEVSEAKSLLEQACLLCRGRSIYPQIVQSIGDYVEDDLLVCLDSEPADLLANRPMDDPLEYILYVTSVGVPSVIYDTVRDLRRARGQRLGSMQRKLPAIHFALLYLLGFQTLFAFPLLGAGSASLISEQNVLTIQAVLFGAMAGAIVMTLQVVFEFWLPPGAAYTVDATLRRMVRGLQEELRLRKAGGMSVPLEMEGAAGASGA